MSGAESWRCHVCGVEARGTAEDLQAHNKTIRHRWNAIDALVEEAARHRESISECERLIQAHTQAAMQVVQDWKATS